MRNLRQNSGSETLYCDISALHGHEIEQFQMGNERCSEFGEGAGFLEEEGEILSVK